MKKLLSKIRWLFNLPKENARLTEERNVARGLALLNESNLERALHKLKVAEWSEDGARAQLMQLRVFGMTAGAQPRTGHGVTAFIPSEAVEALRAAGSDARSSFIHIVAEELVRRALDGLLHINSRGNSTAMIFSPLVPGEAPRPAAIVTEDKVAGLKIVKGEDRTAERVIEAKRLALLRIAERRDPTEGKPCEYPEPEK